MKIPPFNPGPAACRQSGMDYCTQYGAQRLAAIIEAAWTRAGHTVRCEVAPLHPHLPDTTWTVRMPTLVNGLPR